MHEQLSNDIFDGKTCGFIVKRFIRTLIEGCYALDLKQVIGNIRSFVFRANKNLVCGGGLNAIIFVQVL